MNTSVSQFDRHEPAPRVSVIIPTYNGERFLREAIESACVQTLPPVEIIVVDDCSTDGSFELAQSLAPHAPVPLRAIRLSANSGGPARPINVGIGQARGELISVLDQDDVLAPDHLATKAPILAARPDVSVAISWCGIHGDPSGQPKQKPGVRDAILRGSAAVDDYHLASGTSVLALNIRWGMLLVGYPALLFRRSDWLRKGGADERLRIASDFDLLGWLLLQGDCAVIPRVGYFRREHDANVCHRRADMYVESATVRLRLLRQSRKLRRNRRVQSDLRQDLFRMAHGFEQSACYTHAAKIYALAWQLGRRRTRSALSLARLPALRLYDWLTGRRPEPSHYTVATIPSRPSRLATGRT